MERSNFLAQVIFFLWVPFSLYVTWKYSVDKAVAMLAIGGVLMLPELIPNENAYKLPGLPEFGKQPI
ncbi:MAG: hypothetical protein R3A47_09770 [Polyangiales bacterium]